MFMPQASPAFSTDSGDGRRQPGITHILQADPTATGGRPAYLVHSDNERDAPRRVASPGNPVQIGNYRVSIHNDDGAYEQPNYAYLPPGQTVREAAPSGGGRGQVALKPGDVRMSTF